MTSSKSHRVAIVVLTLLCSTACERSHPPAPLAGAAVAPQAPAAVRVEAVPAAPEPTPAAPAQSVEPSPRGLSSTVRGMSQTTRRAQSVEPSPRGLSAMPIAVTVHLPLPTFPTWTPFPPFTPATVPPEPRPSQCEQRDTTQVIVYGADWCGPCRSLKSSLERRSIPFVFVDIDDEAALRSREGFHLAELPAAERRSIPLTRVARPSHAPTWIHGNDPVRIEQAYRSARPAASPRLALARPR